MKKIIITGGLGYIGTELCKIYSGYSWKDEITVIDNRFVSERVNQLREWNINFVHGDILDQDLIQNYCKEADIIHHLAGITDVPRVKSESNPQHEEKIRITAEEGTQNILNSMNNHCKIIMPSTHVVYEGLNEVKLDILENEKTFPTLAYAKSKDYNEKQLISSGKNYIILRLGSVYGYSTDTARIDIMVNFFSKEASQNRKLKLFGGGRQIKSLVSIFDVARCFKFMEEREDISSELFNFTKETVTVKEVAEICKKYNPKIILKETNDEIPNLGFSISNKKILKTGFKFLYSLDQSIKEMISKWSKQNLIKDLYFIKEGENEYIDSRGKISNHELTEAINLIGLINSKKGTIRANHYHPQQEQKCLFTKGKVIEIYKDLLNSNSPKITKVINEGELSIIKPNVAHAMVFVKDTTFLNLVRGDREHGNYGITHTIKNTLVNEEEKNVLLSIYKFNCICCDNNKLKRVISLGYQPLANSLLNNKNDDCELYPLELNYCDNCHNCQLSVAVDPKKIFSNYYYLASTSKSFKLHFEESAKKYIKEFKLNPKKSYIIDVGSNDGIGLQPFKELKFKNLLGIEPAKNLAKISTKRKIKTVNCFLNKKNLKKIKKGADLILASNVFAHSNDLKSMAECMLKLIKSSGSIVIEVQYLMDTLKDLTFDNIYHEHYNYWSLTSLVYFFDKLSAKIYKAEKINTHGGSIRVYVSKKQKIKLHKSVEKILKEEEKFGIKNFNVYKEFSKKIEQIKKNVRKNLIEIKKENNLLVGYGSPAKATTALNFFGISKEIKYIIEDNKLKQGKYVPGVNIPIISKDKIKSKPDNILVLAWNVYDEIKKNNSHLSKKFLSIEELKKTKIKD
tara:strand:- start:2360 stop:4918 length:2559 start_codon:yes stop_codon:yes gene_type:complete